MSKAKDRLFDYARLMKNITVSKDISQKRVSEILDMTEVHMSNVKQKKSFLSVGEVLELSNYFDVCLDEFVKEEYRVRNVPDYSEKNPFGDMGQDEILILVSFLQRMKKYGRQKKERRRGSLHKDYKRLTGAKIKSIREELGISEKEMAEEICVNKSSYQNIERGLRGTSMDNYIIIAKRLEVPISKLFEDVITNKKYVVMHEIWKLFNDMTPKEKREMRRFVRDLAELVEEQE